MYVDPSRVALLVTYAELAESGSEAELEAREAEVRLFVESAWAAASAEGRRRFMDAAGEASGAMPWAAVMVPENADELDLRGPAALELILGQEDLGDEGVGSYRLDTEGDEGREALAALKAWDLAVLRVIAAPAGWQVEKIGGALAPGERPIDDVDDVDDGHVRDADDLADEEQDLSERGSGGASPGASARRASWWPWAAVVGGLGVAGAMVLFPRKSGE